MGSTRTRRVGEMIRQELAALLNQGLKDPRLREITVTEVEMSPDLKKAHVFFACPAGKAGDAEKALAKAAGFIRKSLAAKVYLKYMPELVYRYDDSLDKGAAMDSLLQSLAPDENGGENRDLKAEENP